MQIYFRDTWYTRVWSGLLWIRTRSNGRLLWRWLTSWCHKRQEMSSLTDYCLLTEGSIPWSWWNDALVCVAATFRWLGSCCRQSTWLVQQNWECLWRQAIKHLTMTESVYSRTPLIRNNSEGKQSRYVENPDNWDFSLKICYSGSLQFCCYYLQYVPTSEPFDHALNYSSGNQTTVLYLIR